MQDLASGDERKSQDRVKLRIFLAHQWGAFAHRGLYSFAYRAAILHTITNEYEPLCLCHTSGSGVVRRVVRLHHP